VTGGQGDIWAQIDEAIDTDPLTIREIVATVLAEHDHDLTRTENARLAWKQRAETAEAERDRRWLAWHSARRGRAEARYDLSIAIEHSNGYERECELWAESAEKLLEKIQRVREMAQAAKDSAEENSEPGDPLRPLINAERILAALDQPASPSPQAPDAPGEAVRGGPGSASADGHSGGTAGRTQTRGETT
jgi:hypothetical protein